MPRAKKNIIPITIETGRTDVTGAQKGVVKRVRKRATRKKEAVEVVTPNMNVGAVHTEPAHTADVYTDLTKDIALSGNEGERHEKNTSQKRTFLRYFPLFLLGVCVIFGGVVYMNKPKVYALLNTMHLIPRKETFTELYLNKYPQIPARLLVAKQVYPFTFTVRNIEGVRTAYPYEVYFKNATGTVRNISKRTIVLEDGESAVIREEFRVIDPNEFGTVVINLINLEQEIHFFIPSKY